VGESPWKFESSRPHHILFEEPVITGMGRTDISPSVAFFARPVPGRRRNFTADRTFPQSFGTNGSTALQ